MSAASLQLKPSAAEILRSNAQVKVVFSGRRFGKTRLMLTAGIEECLSKPGAKVFYLAPSRKQAKDIAWADLKTMVPDSWLDRTYESQLALYFRNGSKLILAGADYADGLRGQAADLILADEFSYVSELQEMWEGALLPMLGTTRGRVMFCSTPAGGGNFAAELWERASNTPGWQRWSFKSIDGGWIDETFVEEARATMDPILWRQEFEASNESLLGAVYPEFSKRNIGPTHFNPKERLMFGVDFNRTPFCGCIMQVQGDTLAVLKEYTLVDADTETMASAVRRDFPNFEIWLAPIQRADAFNPPLSFMGLSDQAIPKRGGFLVSALKAPWSIQAKVAAVRLMICDAIGHRRLRLDPKSKRVIRRQATAICPTRSGMPAYTSSHQRMPSSLVITAMSGFSV